jgi:hypothetical protein
MGILQNLKQRKAERAFTDASARYSAAYAQWKNEEVKIDEMIAVVRDCIEGRAAEQFVDMTDYGFMLENDEFPIAYLQGAVYLELDASAGPEGITVADEGHAMVTNTRLMYTGSARTHELDFTKLTNMSHFPLGYTVFAPSGRGKPFGIGYGEGPALDVQFRLEIAVAMARSTLPKYLEKLTAQKQKHSSEAPVPPPPPA